MRGRRPTKPLPGARLLPAELRVWAEAVWAEAGEVPSTLGQLRWLGGGVWLIARQAVMIRSVRHTALFGVGAALLAWTAWSQATGYDSAVVWYLVVTTILVLAWLPRLLRRRFGPVTDSRVARALRVAVYTAIFILTSTLVATLRSKGHAGQHNPPLAGLLAWSFLLLILVGYVALMLMATAQRSRVAPKALVIGTGGGVALGAVMYTIMPLGVDKDASAPWLRGSAIDPLVVLAWVLLLGGPVAAALLAGWRYRRADAQLTVVDAKIRQSAAAGALATTVGSLVVSVLGLVTIALLPRSGVVARVLYGGQHLTSAAIAGHAINAASNGAPGYFLIWLFFPPIGITLGSWTGLVVWHRGSSPRPDRGPGGGGQGDGQRPPAPPGGYAGEPADGQTTASARTLVGA